MTPPQEFLHFSLPHLPSSALLLVAEFFAEKPGTVLLLSGGALDSATRSFLGLFPICWVEVREKQLEIKKGQKIEQFDVSDPWDGLEQHFFTPLSQIKQQIAFGWFGYGMGAFADPSFSTPYRPSEFPDAYWQVCAVVVEADHITGQTSVLIDRSCLLHMDQEEKKWMEALSSKKGWMSFLNGLIPKKSICEKGQNQESLPCFRQSFFQKTAQAHALIRAGEIYQVNLSEEFIFCSNRAPFSIFRQMNECNPAPFSTYFQWEKGSIVCTSPERFLSKKQHLLQTRPIKGTAKREKGREAEHKNALLNSEKERAELLMITDLMRNDLNRVSLPGSVAVKDIWRCEAYANVFHLLSIIESTARPGLSPLQIIRSCFPGGSITGCPKLRAMEVIDALEKRSRGLYTGSIGYVKSNGDFDLNIVIRTLVKGRDFFSLQLGSGIVFDSIDELEYQEILAKGSSLLQSIGKAN